MNQAWYAHMNNKRKMKKKTHNKNSFLVQLKKKINKWGNDRGNFMI
jgi:hypothetical protein